CAQYGSREAGDYATASRDLTEATRILVESTAASADYNWLLGSVLGNTKEYRLDDEQKCSQGNDIIQSCRLIGANAPENTIYLREATKLTTVSQNLAVFGADVASVLTAETPSQLNGAIRGVATPFKLDVAASQNDPSKELNQIDGITSF